MITIEKLFQNWSDVLWGPPMIILLLGTHVFLTIRLRFIQRYIGKAIRLSFSRAHEGEGDVSPFGALTTALGADEIITELRLPPWPKERRWGFQEFARRRGDFAMAGVAAFYDLDNSNKASNAHIGVIGIGDRPHRLPAAEAMLNGRAVDATTIARVESAASAAVEPQEDIHASAAYRRALVGT
jgi:CO/xanthine dehydrogenase FAD-binding subunit